MSMCCRDDFFMYSVFNVVGCGWAVAAYSRGALPWYIAAGYACKVTQNPCRLIDCEGRMCERTVRNENIMYRHT